MAKSKGPCRAVWLCATTNPADTCFHHYHTCSASEGHANEHPSGSGAWHNSNNSVGYVMDSVAAAYRAMNGLGWKVNRHEVGR